MDGQVAEKPTAMETETHEVDGKTEAADRRPVSRAALQRLAADVGARLPAASYEAEADEMEAFVEGVVRQAVRAGACTGRRAVGRAQVQYGLRASGARIPPDVIRLSDTELRRMRRCNVRAPPQTRKPSALSVEIPEASFARLLSKCSARALPPGTRTIRFSAAARRVLHATAETRAAERMLAKSARSSTHVEPATRTGVLPAIARVLEAQGAPPAAAAATAEALECVCSALESLLDIGGCVTVSSAHVAAALESVQLVPVEERSTASTAIAVLDRAVRGRLPDRRFQGEAPRLLASSLLAAAGLLGPN